MIDRVTRLKSVMLSPVLCIIVALPFFAILYMQSPVVAFLSVGVCALMVYNIKSRTLFKGPAFQFIPLYLGLQWWCNDDYVGSIIALVVALILTVLFLYSSRPEETKLYFLIFLGLGIGALWYRSFVLIGCAVFIVMIFLSSFSMRGLVGSFLGLLTPLICLTVCGVLDIFSLIETYSEPFEFGINMPWTFISVVAVFYALIMFLPTYGYPVKMRSYNMSMMGLTVCSILLPWLDSLHITYYLPMLGLCAAYHVSHFAAHYRFGWIGAVLVVAAINFFVMTFIGV